MTWNTISMLLAMLGTACLAAAWAGRKSDHVGDTLMMSALGGGKIALGLGLWLATAQA
jgi:hypothetical protein